MAKQKLPIPTNPNSPSPQNQKEESGGGKKPLPIPQRTTEYPFPLEGGDSSLVSKEPPKAQEVKDVTKKVVEENDSWLSTFDSFIPPQAIRLLKASLETTAIPQSGQVVESIAKAYNRGVASGLSASLISKDAPDYEALARYQRVSQANAPTGGYKEFIESEDLSSALKAFANNPIEVLSTLTTESLSAQAGAVPAVDVAKVAGGAAVGTAVPVIGTATGALSGFAFSNSQALETASYVVESLQEQGYDVTNSEDIERAFSNEEFINQLKREGDKKGLPVAVFDAISMGVAGKLGGKTMVKKLIREVPTQAALGATGEASKQLISEGEISDPVAVLAEGLGEIGGGAPEIVTGMLASKPNLLAKPSSQTIDGRKTLDEAQTAVEQDVQNAPDWLKPELAKKAKEITEAKNKLVNQDAEFYSGFSDEDKNAVSDINERLFEVQDILEGDQELSEGTRKAYEAEATKLLEQKFAIEEKYIDKPTPSTEKVTEVTKTEEDAIQERKTEEVPVGEEAEVGEEVVGEVREQTEEVQGQEEEIEFTDSSILSKIDNLENKQKTVRTNREFNALDKEINLLQSILALPKDERAKFKNTTVRKNDGSLKIVYRSGNINKNKLNFFAEDPSITSRYNVGEKFGEYYLSIKNPLDRESLKGDEKWLNDWANRAKKPKGLKFKSNVDFKEQLIQAAKDGYIPNYSMELWYDFLNSIPDDYDGYVSTDPTEGVDKKIYVTKNSNQVISSDGSPIVFRKEPPLEEVRVEPDEPTEGISEGVTEEVRGEEEVTAPTKEIKTPTITPTKLSSNDLKKGDVVVINGEVVEIEANYGDKVLLTNGSVREIYDDSFDTASKNEKSETYTSQEKIIKPIESLGSSNDAPWFPGVYDEKGTPVGGRGRVRINLFSNKSEELNILSDYVNNLSSEAKKIYETAMDYGGVVTMSLIQRGGKMIPYIDIYVGDTSDAYYMNYTFDGDGWSSMSGVTGRTSYNLKESSVVNGIKKYAFEYNTAPKSTIQKIEASNQKKQEAANKRSLKTLTPSEEKKYKKIAPNIPPRIAKAFQNKANASVLSKIFPPDSPYAPLVKKLSKYFQMKGVKLSWLRESEALKGFDGMWSTVDQKLELNKKSINPEQTIAHELTHAVVENEVKKYVPVGLEGSDYINGLRRFIEKAKKSDNSTEIAVANLASLYLEAAEKAGAMDALMRSANKKGGIFGVEYGFTNLSEFISESFSDRDFQQVLNKLPSSRGKSLWNEFTELVQNLVRSIVPNFNIREGSILEAVLNETGEVIKGQDAFFSSQQKTETKEVTEQPIEGLTEGVSEGVTQRVKDAEANLKDTFDKWRASQKKLGVAFDPRSKAKEDIELLKALSEYVGAKVAEGAYNAKKFAEDLVSKRVEISNPDKLYKYIIGERKKQLKDITKKTKRVSKKLRGGKFYNRSLDVANFLGSLTKIGKITDPQLVNDIQNELNALLQRGIPDVDQNRINALTQRVLDADRATDTRTAKQKASSLISFLRNKEQPKNLQGVISFRVTAEKARNEVENALTLGEITEEEYNNLIEELDSLEEGVNSITPETADSYVALSQSKGDITRTRNRINQALEEGTISKEKADELLSGLEEAQERYDAEAKAFIDENNEKVRGYFSNNKASQLRDQFNLSEPQFILIDKLFDVFRRGDVFLDDVALSDKLSKLVDAFDNGFFPLKDVYEIYRYILSERNADDVVQVIESATKKFKGKSEAEIVRDFSATVLGFRSSKLGKGAKKSKALERTVYAPLIEAIEQSEAATNKILQAFEDATKTRRFSTLTPNGKKRRRRNVILAGVYMNQLNNYLQQGEGNLTSILIKQVDNSKVDVGSIDWLGIILGKEEAINALRGEINETTRQALLQGQLRQEYGVGDLKTMEEVWQSLPKNNDGSVNWKEFFENSEKYLDKETQNFILAANEAFNISYEYIRAAKMMRGEPIDEVIAYYKRARLGVENADIDYRTISFTPNMRVVAGSSIDRVTNAVGAIDFNVLNTVNANAVESTKFFNFEINGGLVNSTLGKALQRSTQKQAVAAIKKDAKQSLNFTYSTKGSKVENFMSKVIGAKYVETLLRGGRLVAEVVSMILRMPFQTGTALSLTYMGKTKTLGRLQEISGINVTPQQSAQIEQGKMSSMRKRSRDSLKASRGKGLADYIGAAMGVAEIALRGGYTYPLFLKNFTMLTGESFDSSKLTDPDYVETYRQAITDAMALTKIENGRIYPTGNKFAERRKVKLVPYFKVGYVDADAWFGRLMNYMSTFVFKESETLFESARYTRDVFAEQGFTNKGVKEAATQVFTSRESGAAIGVLVGGYIYSYITGLDYLLTRLWDDDSDDDEKKQAIDMLQEQYGMTFNTNGDLKKYDVEGDLKGSFGVMQDQLAFFFIGRYGQALRLMTILSGSGIYSKTEDEQLKKQVQEFLRNNFYTNPVNMNEFALRSFAAENIPVIDMGVNVYLDMAEITMEAVDLAKKAVDGELDEEEKAFLRMFNIMFKTTNIALIGKGVQIPETRKIRREIEDELKKKEPKEKKMTFMK